MMRNATLISALTTGERARRVMAYY